MAEKRAEDLVKGGAVDRCKKGELKGLLKELGQSQSGEKGDLVTRVRLYVECGAVASAFAPPRNPASLKLGELRKELAMRGLPCDTSIETRDELLRRLVEAVAKESPALPGLDASSGGVHESAGARSVQDEDPDVALAKRVLELANAGDDAAILSLAGVPVTEEATLGAMRKAYLLLSRCLHPDKLGKRFGNATRAFQELVASFERLSQPQPSEGQTADGDPGLRRKGKTPGALARSNSNCFRTTIRCPRCNVPWGTAVDGVENYHYNFLMEGLKCFACSTCLFEFGCMTAVHECPHCRRPFEYAPADYHRQVTCGSSSCSRRFGFFLFHVPPRVEADLRAEVKSAAEKRLRNAESARARAARAARKRGSQGGGARDAQAEAERSFLRGLSEECPRCGWEPTAADARNDGLAAHLRGCTDERAHAAYRKRVSATAAKADARAAAAVRQEEAMLEAAWQMVGGKASQLWMLSDASLRTRCVEAGLETPDPALLEREELLARLAKHAAASRGGQCAITDGTSTSKRARTSSGKAHVTRVAPRATCPVPNAESLPANLHSLSLRQLREVCAAHGLVPKGRSTDAVINEIESLRFAANESGTVLLLD